MAIFSYNLIIKFYNMDSDLVQLINKLSSDLTNSLKTNLTIFVEKNKVNTHDKHFYFVFQDMMDTQTLN